MKYSGILIQLRITQKQLSFFAGEFGVVYRGNLSGWREQEQVVAVKTLKGSFITGDKMNHKVVLLFLCYLGRFSTHDLDNLVSEGLKMAKFNHPNVMQLIGVCIDNGDVPCVVMPFMTHGSLLSYLRKHRADLTIANEDNMELVRTNQTLYVAQSHLKALLLIISCRLILLEKSYSQSVYKLLREWLTLQMRCLSTETLQQETACMHIVMTISVLISGNCIIGMQ